MSYTNTHTPNANANDLDPSMLKRQNDQLLTMIENAKYQRDASIAELEDYKTKYTALSNLHSKLQNDLNQQRLQSQRNLEIRNISEKKLKEEMVSVLNKEKKLTSALNQADRLEHESALLRTQLEHFKQAYNEMEQRKNAEIKLLSSELSSLRTTLQESKSKNDLLESSYSELKFTNAKLNQDLTIKKMDCDHLTKTLEDSNHIVLSAQEKEKHFDSIEKSYKQRHEELTLELEKAKVNLKMQMDQNTKINDDYTKLLQQRNEDFDSTLQYNKSQYDERLNELNDEMTMTKGQMVSMKIERDKYYSEYSILRKEIDRMTDLLREENEKFMHKCQENDQALNRMQIHFQDKTRLTMLRNETLEKDNRELSERLEKYIKEEEERNDLMSRMNLNEDELTKEIVQIKESYEQSERERRELEKKYYRLQVKYKQLEDLSDMRVNALESTLKIKKGQCEIIENKVYELMKTQEDITGKMRSEYLSTGTKLNEGQTTIKLNEA